MDSYGPFDSTLGAGPVSRKFTQLADIKESSAVDMLREAYRKYRPGMKFANVKSRPDNLPDDVISGQLWLEVPVQTKPIPALILNKAKELNIRIRDINGIIY